MDFQVSLSTSSGTKESISAEISSRVDEETTVNDENDKETTLGDALNSVKDTSLASVEELQNLAGGADIKVHILLYGFVWNLVNSQYLVFLVFFFPVNLHCYELQRILC